MKSNKGFTLIELMIVVAIIAIIAAIAIPNLLRARLASNESSAIGSLRTLASAQSSFQSADLFDADLDGTGAYGSFDMLTGYTPPFIDEVLGSGTKSGYNFTITTDVDPDIGETIWACAASPVGFDSSGHRSFWVDESGVVRGGDNAGADYVRADVYPGGGAPPAVPPIGG